MEKERKKEKKSKSLTFNRTVRRDEGAELTGQGLSRAGSRSVCSKQGQDGWVVAKNAGRHRKLSCGTHSSAKSFRGKKETACV